MRMRLPRFNTKRRFHKWVQIVNHGKVVTLLVFAIQTANQIERLDIYLGRALRGRAVQGEITNVI